MLTPNFLSYPADSEFAVQSILQYVQYLQVYSREELIGQRLSRPEELFC